MKKRVVSMLLAVVMMLGMFPGTALAAGSVEEALGEVNIYNGEQKLSYLSIKVIYRAMLIDMLSGWMPIYMAPWIFPLMFVLSFTGYLVISLLQMKRIKKIPMDEALKNVE